MIISLSVLGKSNAKLRDALLVIFVKAMLPVDVGRGNDRLIMDQIKSSRVNEVSKELCTYIVIGVLLFFVLTIKAEIRLEDDDDSDVDQPV